MATTVGSLGINFETNVATILNDFQKITRGVTGMESTMSKSLGVVAGLWKGLIASSPVIALTALTKHSMGVIGATKDMAEAQSVSIREMQAQSLVAREAGGVQDKLAAAYARTNKAVVEAITGSKEQRQAFRALQLDTKELLSLSPEKRFAAVGEALAKIEDPAVRGTLAVKIFGKEGERLIPMFADFGRKLDEARAFNDKFNISLSKMDVSKVSEASDTLGRMKDAAIGLGNTLAIQLSPIITEIGKNLLNAGVDGKSFGDAVAAGMNTAAAVIDVVRIALQGLRLVISDVTLALATFLVDANYQIQQTAKSLIEMGGAWGIVGDKMLAASEKVTDPLQNWAKGVYDVNVELNKNAENFELVYDKMQRIQEAASRRALGASKDGAGGGNSGARALQELAKETDNLDKRLEQLGRRTIGGVVDALGNLAMGAGKGKDAFKSFAVSVLQDMQRLIMQSTVTPWLEGLFGVGKAAASGSSGGGFGSLLSGAGKFISSIFGGFKADGGKVQRGKAYIVGEKRPELFMPGQSGTIIPQVPNGGGATYYIDATGADKAAIARLEASLVALHGSIEKRAVAAVFSETRRNPGYIG